MDLSAIVICNVWVYKYYTSERPVFVHRRTNELREKLSSAQEEMRQLDMDIEENQGYWYFLIAWTI